LSYVLENMMLAVYILYFLYIFIKNLHQSRLNNRLFYANSTSGLEMLKVEAN
jgi:hypothetical protein